MDHKQGYLIKEDDILFVQTFLTRDHTIKKLHRTFYIPNFVTNCKIANCGTNYFLGFTRGQERVTLFSVGITEIQDGISLDETM